jgi:cardiolipin synthase C
VSQYLRNHHCLIALIVLLPGCATRLPASYYPRETTYALKDTSDTRLGKVYAQLSQKHPGKSGFHILSTGPEALMMRIALIESSQRSIDLQYFSARNDATGKLLLQAITRAADRGVRVRILLDDWNLDDFGVDAVSLNTNPNIDIRVFNPYSTHDESFLAHLGNIFVDIEQFTRRMHNKAIIADNQISIIGGRNLGDEYFDASKDNDFQDIDVFASGPITQQISNNFDVYWNSEESFPIAALNLAPPDETTVIKLRDERQQYWDKTVKSPIGIRLIKMPLPREVKNGDVPLIWATAELAADNPDKIDQSSETAVSAPSTLIYQMAAKAQHEFIIFTPYFVPLDTGVKWLNDLVAKGVAVRIITNSLSSTDMVPAQAGYSHYRKALVKGGVELYEIKSSQPKPSIKRMFRPSSQNGLHAKIYMVDRHDLIVGSFNFDPRSIRLNTEQVIIIHSPELCTKIAVIFHEMISPLYSYHVVLTSSTPAMDGATIEQDSLAWMTEENGEVVYYDFNPHAGFWRDITDNFLSLIPFDNQL